MCRHKTGGRFITHRALARSNLLCTTAQDRTGCAIDRSIPYGRVDAYGPAAAMLLIRSTMPAWDRSGTAARRRLPRRARHRPASRSPGRARCRWRWGCRAAVASPPTACCCFYQLPGGGCCVCVGGGSHVYGMLPLP